MCYNIMCVCVYICIYSTLIALWVYIFKNCSNVLTRQTLKAIRILSTIGIFLE